MNNSLSEVHPELVSEWSEKNKIKPTEVSIGSHKKVIWRCEKGVDLVPANLELSAMEFNLVNAMSRETTLKNYLSQVKNRYDYVMILSILVDTFISKISFPMQPGPEIGSFSDA